MSETQTDRSLAERVFMAIDSYVAGYVASAGASERVKRLIADALREADRAATERACASACELCKNPKSKGGDTFTFYRSVFCEGEWVHPWQTKDGSAKGISHCEADAIRRAAEAQP